MNTASTPPADDPGPDRHGARNSPPERSRRDESMRADSAFEEPTLDDDAFDALLAEFLAEEERAEAGEAVERTRIETWLERAGRRAADFAQFVADHRRIKDVAAGESPRATDDLTIGWNSASPLNLQFELGRAEGLRERRPVEGAPPKEFGDYELLDEIARGGMGVVYRARHRKLDRVVALKMILSAEMATEDDVQRFHKEATAAARLDHPGIVPVFEVGQFAGRHFFTMALVEGPSLAERLADGPFGPRPAAAVVLKLAEAIAFAHSKGIVHRDLKPANVLLSRVARGSSGSSGSSSTSVGDLATLIGGEPKVTDFGLAKPIADSQRLTLTGQVVGTPSYMAPEQAAGRSNEIGPSSDVYSLGAVLYELLVGRPPFRASTPLETMLQVLESEPAPPRLLNAQVDRDLQTICLKCLEKHPAARYASAQALADDLRRYLEGETIAARSLPLLSRVTRALGRRRHEAEFEGWGRAITLLGLIVLATHLAIAALESRGLSPLWSYWTPRIVMFGLLALNIAWHRPHGFLPRNAAERLIWSVWIGFFLALGCGNLLIATADLPIELTYSLSLIAGGLAFFSMGGHVWGGCYLIGVVFWIAAPLLAMSPQHAPPTYGALWGAAMTLLGAHYWARSTPDAR